MDGTHPPFARIALEPDEPALIRLSQQGDQEMFAHLYNTYTERIYRYVYFRVSEDELAQDITSQVFLKAWLKLNSYQPGHSPFMAWLYRIAHNAVVDHYRAKKEVVSLERVNPLELSHTDEVDERLDLQVRAQTLRNALQTLTEQQKQVIILKFIGGLSTTEIAQQLGKQQGAVRALQMRALQILARCPVLQREQNEPPARRM